MDIDFHCTKCGNCCKDLRLPLSIAEALDWLHDDNPVQVLCEAIPWPEDIPSSNPYAELKWNRAFSAQSGQLPIRVLVTLAAPLGNSCPHLLADNSCGIYERRPLVCRIYPAEINPFLDLTPEHRHCPPEAWQIGSPPLMRQGIYTNQELRLLISTKLTQLINDIPSLETLCNTLGIHIAAMANEGYAAHTFNNAALLSALIGLQDRPNASAQNWIFISDRNATVAAILSCEAKGSLASSHQSSAFEYLSLLDK